jgi:hypothetical protein
MFTVYLLTLDSNMEETLTSCQLFPTLISSIPWFSKTSKILLLDSLSNLVKNHSCPEKFFTIRDLTLLTKYFDLSDFSSQSKLLDILDNFLDVEDSLDYEWVIFICEDHIHDTGKSKTFTHGGFEGDARNSMYMPVVKMTQNTLYSQVTSSFKRQSGNFPAIPKLIDKSNTNKSRASNMITPNQFYSMMTGSHIDQDLSKSSSNIIFNKFEYDQVGREYNVNVNESKKWENSTELRICKYCSSTFSCKKVFAINKKILEDVFSKKRNDEFDKYFGKNFQVQELTKGFSTISIGTFRVSKFSLNHVTFSKMNRFVFSFLASKIESYSNTSSSKNMSPLVKENSPRFMDKQYNSSSSELINIKDQTSIDPKLINFKKELNFNFNLSDDKNSSLLPDPKHRFSLCNNPKLNANDNNSRRTSEMPQQLIENNLSIIKENEGSESYNSGTDSFTSGSKPFLNDHLRELQSEEPIRDSIFQKLLIMFPQRCTCQDILSLKSFLNTSSVRDIQQNGSSNDSTLKDQHKIDLKERLVSYEEIFKSLISHRNLFDMNFFVIILRKFVRIFFTQHQPLKLFKMLSSQVLLTRKNNFHFVPYLKKIGLFPKKLSHSVES